MLIGEVSGLLLAAVIVGTMLLLLGLGVWIGLALIGVAFVAMVTGSSRMQVMRWPPLSLGLCRVGH